MFRQVVDILIRMGSFISATYLAYPGFKRLVEGPEIELLSGFQTTTGGAVLRIFLGFSVLILAGKLRNKISRYSNLEVKSGFYMVYIWLPMVPLLFSLAIEQLKLVRPECTGLIDEIFYAGMTMLIMKSTMVIISVYKKR